MDVTFCGALNTLGSFADNLPETATFGIGGFFTADAYTALVLNTCDAVLDNQIDTVFCLERTEDIVFNAANVDAELNVGVDGEIPAGVLDQNTVDNLDLLKRLPSRPCWPSSPWSGSAAAAPRKRPVAFLTGRGPAHLPGPVIPGPPRQHGVFP